eukprot:6902888-Prymnesium_polylepis.1
MIKAALYTQQHKETSAERRKGRPLHAHIAPELHATRCAHSISAVPPRVLARRLLMAGWRSRSCCRWDPMTMSQPRAKPLW